jgi:hypothetical protein
MSFSLTPDPREQSFLEHWKKYSNVLQGSNHYWNPNIAAWGTYPPSEFAFADAHIEKLDTSLMNDHEIFKHVEERWREIKASAPQAVFDPHDRSWKIATRIEEKSPSDNDHAARMKLAKKELDEVDAEFQEHVLVYEEWKEKRQEIIARYRL